ncbi:signal recognition particle [Micromonospora sp. NPDC005979]|uniref:pPIWI_RE_Z domain-containing protein n=1 Tax=Micromonospora sp. NPDC005979 TaxID=3156726 RepID=UPI00339E9B50
MRSPKPVLQPVLDLLLDVPNINISGPELQTMCEVEVGLWLQQSLIPKAAAADAWPLFSGYPFARAWGLAVDERLLRVARHTLWPYQRQTAWADMLDFYNRCDPRLRGFSIPDPRLPAERLSPAFAPKRWEQYDELLRQAPPFTRVELPPASAGRYRFSVGQAVVGVSIPDRPKVAPQPHDLGLSPTGRGAPLTISRWALLKTARDMDECEPQDWYGRLERTDFFTRGDRTFDHSDDLPIDRIQHLLGIVGAGKSTIRDIITIHLARRHMRVTVVVGDVAEVLKLVQLYNTHLGDQVAAPIVGSSARERHAQRLHRRIASRETPNVLGHDDPGFQYLSTSCVINNLLPTDDEPLTFNEAPCDNLYAEAPARRGDGERMPKGRRSACPYWSGCPRHHGERALVDAAIWVTTPAGLVESPAPRPQNAERVRYLELACRRSDLMIVDEADRVQMQLDQSFAPAVSLVGGAGNRSLLDDLNTHRIRELASSGRTQLSDRDVENWTAAVNVVTAATDRLYAMLVGDRELRRWVRVGYFNAWTLQLRLIEDRYPAPDDLAARTKLTERLDEFRDNPFADRRESSEGELVRLAAELLYTNYPALTRSRLGLLMRTMFDLEPVLAEKRKAFAPGNARTRRETPEQWVEKQYRRFGFMLLVSMLERKLSLVNAMWPRVEMALKLNFNQMYRGPVDHRPVVPESPMGNVVGFQFIVSGPDPGGVRSGELQYFRCLGVGRELLRAMPGLAEVDAQPPTNVLLMSGSSWAGVSSRYHLPVPVGVILKPKPAPCKDRPGIDDSEARIEFLGSGDAPIRVSGKQGDARDEALRTIAQRLGEQVDDRPSRLECELLELPEARRRILLLVGSYEETAVVADALHTLSERWRGHVLRLVADDDETFDVDSNGDDLHAGILRRGDVDNLAETGADVLVAPLLAVERGHNILNDANQAAIGTVYFLIRPHPRPDDIFLAIHAINDWIVRAIDSGAFDTWVRDHDTIAEAAREVRKRARSKWYGMLARPLSWGRLREDRDSVTWDMLVLMWQVIGRLVRGGVPARIVFVDAAFAPNLAEESELPDTRETSLLHSVLYVLRPYFDDASYVPEHDRFIVDALYRPLWLALDRCIRPTVER